MWIGFIAGWVIASVTLYGYLVATATEPRHKECMDCRQSDCGECSYASSSKNGDSAKRAA
jgi:hypothetical protein